MSELLKEKLEALQASIRQAALSAGADVTSVTLVAVSKKQSYEAIASLYGLGQRHFAENYAQELFEKQKRSFAQQQAIRWHMIGHLQRNKIKKILPGLSLLQTLDSIELAQALQQALAQKTMFEQRALWGLSDRLDVLLQVRLPSMLDRRGFLPQELEGFCQHLKNYPKLRLRGLMVLPPQDAERPIFFKIMQNLWQKLRSGYDAEQVDTLSMGMSNDFIIAVASGATMVRLGTALFGSRH